MKHYTKTFYKQVENEAKGAASLLVPFLINLIKPKSVIDVGCGTGIWVQSFMKNGIIDAMGIDFIDGNETEDLLIPKTNFIQLNLEKKFIIDRTFDCVLCFEVAEHLSPTSAEKIVSSLVSLGNVIVFSAAIPGQTGTHHVNEQWPDYWSKKFAKRNYVAFDCIRPTIWNNSKIEWWYSQNTILYINKKYYDANQTLQKKVGKPTTNVLALVHPINWRLINERLVQANNRNLNINIFNKLVSLITK